MTNPFAGIEHLFAADREPVRFESEMYGRPVFVEYRPLDASADARLQSKLFEVGQAASTPGGSVDFDDLQLEVLIGAVSDFQFIRRKPAKDGRDWVYEATPPGKSLAVAQRKTVFRELDKSFRVALLQVACEVCGLDPLAAGLLPIHGSSEDSASSETSTGNTDADSDAGSTP